MSMRSPPPGRSRPMTRALAPDIRSSICWRSSSIGRRWRASRSRRDRPCRARPLGFLRVRRSNACSSPTAARLPSGSSALAAISHRDGPGLFGARCRIARGRACRCRDRDRAGIGARELSQSARAHQRGHFWRMRRHSPGLRVPGGECGLCRSLPAQGIHLHRPATGGHSDDGGQGRGAGDRPPRRRPHDSGLGRAGHGRSASARRGERRRLSDSCSRHRAAEAARACASS